ncbi:uncharacterized protein Dvir_GJ26002 [Drosophila virilis]|uniref:Uncharacterized protein n=1 Tax=Drosophila virilis TaxID=7244 RepID=A0A0Q9WMT1_DROVI|nr:uncharacterized protein Dvir_GJ26002 [Drosophila virilis]
MCVVWPPQAQTQAQGLVLPQPLRHDELTKMSVKELYNSEVLAMLCMSELADFKLLNTMAQSLHRIRESQTLIVAATNQLFARRPFLPYSRFVLNLWAFAGVLGLPMPLRRYRTTISLQQIIMVMCIFSLVLCSFFNANLSTLLTKHPYYKQIENFEELRDSDLQFGIERFCSPDQLWKDIPK